MLSVPCPNNNNSLFLLALMAVLASVSGGCTNSAITPEATEVGMPADWTRGGDQGAVDLNWLESFDDPQLTALVSEAITSNYLLEQERARLYEAEQIVTIVRANRFPFWEVDLWGRLSKEQQAAQLAFGAQEARFEFVQRNVAAATAAAYYRVMEANALLDVATQRLDNGIESHDIVASGYRQGLNDALDLYLARNVVERQQANYAQREQVVAETIADLQLALARYPSGRMEIPGTLPVMTDPIPSGLPSELITRRTDLQEAWLNLLAADADLAAAHKARFPSLSLVGSAGVTSAEFSDLLDTDLSVWSIAGSATQPLFNAGRLEAREEQAYARVRQAEQQYLNLVFNAFADVENAISRSVSLRERYESFLDAETNSRAALELALEQYQRGLVPYTTVLESQRQAFDAVETVVELRNLLLQNRIVLYLALGGEFATEY
jgi:NodT family efflux transporter outer membrane factor (OMF) lipoprotein